MGVRICTAEGLGANITLVYKIALFKKTLEASSNLNRAAMAEGHREAILVVNMHPLRAVGA